MSGMDINDFMSDTKGGGKSAEHLDLKKKGKATVFLHPKSGIFKRNVYWFPVYGEVTDENKKKSMKTYQTRIVCPGNDKNPIMALRQYLKDHEEIDNDEVILRVGKGKEEVEYVKGEVIGVDGYNWKKFLSYKTEYIFGVVDTADASKTQVLVAPKSLGKKITKVIEDQIEEEGDELGNPFKNPYAFKLTYDKDASQASDTYNAVWNKSALTDEIQEQLDSDGPNNKPLADPTSVAKIAYILREALVGDPSDYDLDLSEADNFDPKELNLARDDDSEGDDKPAKSEKKQESKKQEAKKPASTPAKTVKGGEAKKPAAPKVKTVECPSCEKDIPEDAMSCEHCGAEFEEVQEIQCPSCESSIPADSKTCPECGEDVQPF